METKYAQGKFPIYYDMDKEVSNKLHQQWKLLKLGRMPGMIIINKEGIIKWAYYSDSMSDIPKNNDVLEVIKEINE
jgi:alkyl hydroperoxide reductase subunit AhpC